MIEDVVIDCPTCKTKVHIPFFRGLKAKSIEEADMAEESARSELADLRWWLSNATPWDLLCYWWKEGRRRKSVKKE